MPRHVLSGRGPHHHAPFSVAQELCEPSLKLVDVRREESGTPVIDSRLRRARPYRHHRPAGRLRFQAREPRAVEVVRIGEDIRRGVVAVNFVVRNRTHQQHPLTEAEPLSFGFDFGATFAVADDYAERRLPDVRHAAHELEHSRGLARSSVPLRAAEPAHADDHRHVEGQLE
jgi:hypothetical protein